MAKKFYVVWAGRRTGVFTDWPTTQGYVDKFAGARFKSFATRAEAEQAFRSGRPPSSPRPQPRTTSELSSPQVARPPEGVGLQIYCDGACEPNPGRAGSGIAVYRDGQLMQLWYGLYNPNGTNNTAELNALHHALLMCDALDDSDQTAQILCDSTYALNCVSKWAAGWEKKGWRKTGGEIRNLDIIQPAYELYSRLESRVNLVHVSAHVGTQGNELADRMAMFAVERRTVQLRQYDGALDIPALLRMRAG